MLALSQAAFAIDPPNAGSQLQQIQPIPEQPKALPGIRVERDNLPAANASEGEKIQVRTLHISGAKSTTEAELLALTGFQPDSALNLAELRAMAAKITAFYRAGGHFVAQAYLPPQDIKNSSVRIDVIEGAYGQISLRNQSRLQDSTANRLLGGLNTGDAIVVAPLEQRLLLLSDLPGVSARSTLTPGASVGSSDLIIDLANTKRVSGSIDADNQGNRYTGAYRVGASVYVNEIAGLGDVASARVLTSGDGLKYGRAVYQAQLGKAKAGIAYTSMDYRLGKEFSAAELRGNAQIASLYASYPLMRSRAGNLYAQLALDDKTFRDKQGTGDAFLAADKKAQVWMASLNGDYRDALGTGGFSTYSATWTSGEIDLKTAQVRANDAGSARSNGHYDKLSYNLTRLQSLSPALSLYASLNGQLASKNLDSSEKISLGGIGAVRAYPSGETYADQAHVLTLEARRQFGQQFQGIVFADVGVATLNKTPWAGVTTSNSRTLSGAGLGVNWIGDGNLVVKASYAFKLGSQDATSAPDKSGRFWLQVVNYF
ncbi:MAG: ShlB/FhaC/HecB family hemolysin secretion/activation protein [Cypionkella sp.]